jgi:hypothetical protein
VNNFEDLAHASSDDIALSLPDLFETSTTTSMAQTIDSPQFSRMQVDYHGNAELVLDTFPDSDGIACCFLRVPPCQGRSVRIVGRGARHITPCSAGGWILVPQDTSGPYYWIPQPPLSRTLDTYQRILSETRPDIADFSISADELSLAIQIPEGATLDMTVWRLPSSGDGIPCGFDEQLSLESQPLFLLNSQTGYQSLSDIYLYLVHGHVYVNRFIWPRKWKICSELDAYGLYVIMTGMERATGKRIYNLIRRQLVFSVIARQSNDGGWYHGEWTDRMESHYRFHNGAMLLLESALAERPEPLAEKSLKRAAEFISRTTDKTDIGLWFLHDSLEESAETMRELCEQTGSTWIPARTLGKSPTNKLILNTHIDSIVSLARYRDVTGDPSYTEIVSSALSATRSILGMRPAETLYRIVYRAIGLTLLPKSKAVKLPLPVRAFKRITWMYLMPKLHRLKQIFPRLVMPGGFIERHLSMPHYDINYHPVNILDLTRLWRCFPDEQFNEVIGNALSAVTGSSILEYWADFKPRYFSLVVWVEALYHLCTLDQEPTYRKLLAEGIMSIDNAGLGLPPCLLGSEPEAVAPADRQACPSPADSHLRVANLGCHGRGEIIVINNTAQKRTLSWEGELEQSYTWTDPEGNPCPATAPIYLKAHSWLWGRA